MKRNLLLIASILCCTLFINGIKAQNTLSLPNGSFENWSSGQGYSVSVLFFSLPVYDAYTYPTNWNYIAYPVNQDINYSGFTINVNTNVPLLKVSQATGSVPDGNKAVKMETFMLSDIINSTVYSLAESSLDTSLTNLVAPTVLSTGAVNVNSFVSLLSTITSNMGSQSQLIAALHDEDINEYISGGIALNGFQPSRLTGSYKYTSASANGDNGGVLIIGTKYNPVTHRREAVGGGYNISLNDIATYTEFEVAYQSLHELDPQYDETEADSLIVMLISSANNHRQQGSALYLDHLQLIQDTIPVTPTEPDTCNTILNLTVISVDTNNATLAWNNEEIPAAWQYAYGEAGFTVDENVLFTINDSTLELNNLLPGTTYDCYVRAQCNDTLFSNWRSVTFTTDTIVPPTPPTPPIDTTGINEPSNAGIRLFPNPAHGQILIQSEQSTPTAIRIYNVAGKLLEILYPTSEKTAIELPASGMYIIETEVAGKRFSQKVISR